MQKIIRINTRNRRSLFKKGQVQKARAQKQADKDYWDTNNHIKGQIGVHVRAERKTRREDWTLGVLAPDRDTGLDRGQYGAFDGSILNTYSRPQATRTDGKREATDRRNIVVGDRVVVIQGPHKGQISEVIEVDRKQGSVTVQDINKLDVKAPVTAEKTLREQKIQAMEKPLPIDDVRLVFKPEGFNEDIIVRYIERGERKHWSYREPFSTRPEWTRYVAGTDIEIPWPAETVPDPIRYEGDTTREILDQFTYVPSIINPPFEAGIMEEFTNKYSKTKREHDESYVATKIIEDARSAWYDSRKLQTPKSQLMEKLMRKRQRYEEGRANGCRGVWRKYAAKALSEAQP